MDNTLFLIFINALIFLVILPTFVLDSLGSCIFKVLAWYNNSKCNCGVWKKLHIEEQNTYNGIDFQFHSSAPSTQTPSSIGYIPRHSNTHSPSYPSPIHNPITSPAYSASPHNVHYPRSSK